VPCWAGQAKPDGARKVALITGITGQDGSYLAELLISKGYVVRLFFSTALPACP
jgi:hypothetical protein